MKGTDFPYVCDSAKESHLLLYLIMELIEFYQLRFLDINIKHVLLHLNPVS